MTHFLHGFTHFRGLLPAYLSKSDRFSGLIMRLYAPAAVFAAAARQNVPAALG